MAESYGWAGKILRVNLTTGEITTQDDEKYHKYIGGMGMAYRIMYEEAPMELDPYDEKALVIFGVGPLTGAGVPCSGRMNVTFRSTWSKGHSIIDAHMGGHIGSMLKYAGYIECVPNYIYRTKRIKEIGGFVDFPLAWCSDTATNNLMAENGCSTSKNILFSFRMSGENISSISKKNNEITKQKIKAAYMFYCHLEQLFNKIPQPSSKLEQYVRSSAYSAQMGIVKTSFSYFSSVLSFQEFLRLVKFMRKKSLVTDKYEVMRMFAKWWYAKRHK